MADGRTRCTWVSAAAPLDRAYHDEEWGVPVHDDVRLFEMLTLEGAQAGLSWSTILKKRDGYRAAFAGFDPRHVARFDDADVARCLADPGIVRNRLKVASTVSNARALLALQEESSFTAYLWDFVDGAPLTRPRRSSADIPSETEVSRRMSRDLKRRGFRFVGPTICYALMQAAGLVNDHEVGCFRHTEVAHLA